MADILSSFVFSFTFGTLLVVRWLERRIRIRRSPVAIEPNLPAHALKGSESLSQHCHYCKPDYQ